MLTATRLDPTIFSYLIQDGLLREGHFEYHSGRHSAVSLDRDRMLADPQAASRMGYALAKAFFTAKIDTVAAPSIWGGGLAQWVAYFLDPRAKVIYSTPLPEGGSHIAENLHGMIEGKRVLLIDNVMLSGETMQHLDADITALGGEVLGIGCLWAVADEAPQRHEVFGLFNHRYPSYLPDECPMCKDGHEKIELLPY